MRALDPDHPPAWRKGRDELLSLGRPRRFHAGDELLSPMHLSAHAALITEGLVKLTGKAADGRETLLYIRGRGDLLNEEAAVRGTIADGREPELRIFATALTDGTARVFPLGRLREFFEHHPAHLMAAAQHLSERLEEAETRIARMGHNNAGRRLARLLCELERYGKPFPDDPFDPSSVIGTEIPLSLTRTELGAWIGACRETVNRILGDWRARGIVGTGYRLIVVLDLQALARVAGIQVSRQATWSLPPQPRAPRPHPHTAHGGYRGRGAA